MNSFFFVTSKLEKKSRSSVYVFSFDLKVHFFPSVIKWIVIWAAQYGGKEKLHTSKSLLTASLLSFCWCRYRSHLHCCFGRCFHYFHARHFLYSINLLYFFPLPFDVSSNLYNMICHADRNCSVCADFFLLQFERCFCCEELSLSTDKWRCAATHAVLQASYQGVIAFHTVYKITLHMHRSVCVCVCT